MTAYAVFIHQRTIDPEEMARYAPMVMATLEGHPATILAKYGVIESLEGDAVEGAVILSFPTMEAARLWYHGEKYQHAARHRFAGAKFQVLLTEGLA